MKLAEFSVRRPVTVVMITISVAVLGFLSLGRLPLTLMPEFSSPNLSVFVTYPSSSPQEVERHITRPLEEVLSTLNHLERLNSTSSSTGANVRLEFKPGTDMDLASLDVRDRIDQVSNRLPVDVERIRLRRFQSGDMPVFRFAVAWQGQRRELFDIIEDVLRPRLERIDGVASVEVRGVDSRQILIEVDQGRLMAHGVDMVQLNQALRANNVNFSGGYVVDGDRKYSLRTVGEFRHIEELAALPLGNGRITVGDVALIRFDYPEKTNFSRLNSRDAVTVSVFKTSTANVVRVCNLVHQEIGAIVAAPEFEGDLSFQVFSDQSREIMRSLDDLKVAGIYGGLLAALVLFLFLLKFRSTLIISVAIPVSVVFTFAIMYLLRVFFGAELTINVVTLTGLMVAVGMLVDNSVVVLENIYRYKQQQGLEAREAAIRGAQEVGVAVLASTATTLVVFVSYMFTPGLSQGRFVTDFGTTVSIAVAASLVVALTLIPMLSAKIFTGKERPVQKPIVWMSDTYGGLMAVMLRRRYVAVILMAAIGYSSYYLFTNIDREMFPSVVQRQIRVDVRMERSYAPEDMLQIFEHTEGILLANREDLEIQSVSSNFNSRTTNRGQYRGSIELFLKEDGSITAANVIQDRMRQLLPHVPGVEFRFGRMRRFGGGGDLGVEIRLQGDNPVVLTHYAQIIQERLLSVPGVVDVQSTLESGDDEIHLSVDRMRAEQAGVSAFMVARAVSSALSDRAVTRFKTDDGEIDVIVQLREGNQLSLQELENVRLENRQGEMVPLHAMVGYSYERGPISIQRDDRKSTVNVVANLEQGGMSIMAQERIGEALLDVGLPGGYSWSFGRQWQRFQQDEQANLFAIYLAILFMYIIMAALFESFVQPLTMLLCVPFSLIGVAGMFYLTGTTVNQMAYLGILILFGIVVNNGIILINHIIILRQQGLPRDAAILRGGMDRLRPILMTAATSLFGILPLTLPTLFPEQFGALEGRARMWAPVSLAVLGGLTTSTFLTLIILPTVYSLMDDLSNFVVRWVSRGWRLVCSVPALVWSRG